MTTDSVCVYGPQRQLHPHSPLSLLLQLSVCLSIRINSQSSCFWSITPRTLNHYSKHISLAAIHSCFALTVTQHVCVCACISVGVHALVSCTCLFVFPVLSHCTCKLPYWPVNNTFKHNRCQYKHTHITLITCSISSKWSTQQRRPEDSPESGSEDWRS